MSGMTITFGLHQNDADWSDKQAALGEIHVGQEGMLSLLQTHLGLGGVDESVAIRIEQYRKRMEAVNSDSAWFHKSFELDRWSTAKQLLNWRDELIFAGWDGKPLPAGISKRLDALSEIENKNKQVPLVKGTAEKLLEVLNEIDYLDASCIKSIQLTEPLELLPYLWQKVFEKLKDLRVTIEEPQLQAPNVDIGNKSLVLLEADTEWEAAEALAMWLAADKEKNDDINMIVQGVSSALDFALHRMGLPRSGNSESSKWRANLQILPLVFANAWEPIELGSLLSLLSLPNSPIPRIVRSNLLRALRKEAGVKGEEWNKAIERIKEKYVKEDWETAKIEKLLIQIDDMLVSKRFNQTVGMSESEIVERCNWIIDSDQKELDVSKDHAKVLKQLVSGCGNISRVQLDRMIDSLISGESLGIKAEASPWNHATHPGSLTASRPILIWWNFIKQASASATYWNTTERKELEGIGIVLDKIGTTQAREAYSWKNAFLKAGEKIILVRCKKLRGEDTTRHPLWDMITAFAEIKWGKDAAKKFIYPVTNTFFAKEDWNMFGRKGKAMLVSKNKLPIERHSFDIPKQLIKQIDLGKTSYSDMKTLLECPLKWVLQNKAKMRYSDMCSIPKLHLSVGNLFHKIAEEIFKQPKDKWTSSEAERLFDDKVKSMAIELCAEGSELEKKRQKNKMVAAITELVKLINENHYEFVSVEDNNFNLSLDGVPFRGRLDLILKDKNGAFIVIDYKTDKTDKYKKEEIKNNTDLQLASYVWMIENRNTNAKVTAAYYMVEHGYLLDDNQEHLELVFSNGEQAWKTELKNLEMGTVIKGKEKNESKDKTENDDDTNCVFKLEVLCKYCDYFGLCKPNVNKTDSTEDDVE
ncbi:MAG: PD-(D/E)XK nuclease family protein [Termitinemataceae bacterium]|nr:MAG: PD-(D/E)XK nuclease family protein [Termitinemataceae bacterium]